MARNRMIKLNFWEKKKLARVSRDARLLFVGMWNFADDYGVLLDSNQRLLGDIFPHDDDITAKDIENWKKELLAIGSLLSREWEGTDYLIMPSWDEHQKVDKPSSKRFIPENVLRSFIEEFEENRHNQGIASRESRESLGTEIEIERERERENNTSSKDEEAGALTDNKKILEFGNKEINQTVSILKVQIGVENFADSQKWERIYAKHLTGMRQKLGDNEFIRRLKVILEDDFHKKNANKIRYVYEQMKGFIEPTDPLNLIPKEYRVVIRERSKRYSETTGTVPKPELVKTWLDKLKKGERI